MWMFWTLSIVYFFVIVHCIFQVVFVGLEENAIMQFQRWGSHWEDSIYCVNIVKFRSIYIGPDFWTSAVLDSKSAHKWHDLCPWHTYSLMRKRDTKHTISVNCVNAMMEVCPGCEWGCQQWPLSAFVSGIHTLPSKQAGFQLRLLGLFTNVTRE